MNSFIAWIGGKHILSKQIVSMMPEHKTYVEVFGGAGWVLFKKNSSKIECWNDLNGNLANLFRVVRCNLEAFKRRYFFLLSSRDEYMAFQKALKTGKFKDNIDRAIAFYYCVKNSFGSGVYTGFAFSPERPPRIVDFEHLKEIRDRLQNVYIENVSYDRLVPNWDRKETLFYCDPPYLVCLMKPGANKYYQFTFDSKDHERLRDILKGISGRVILSYDDHPDIRKLYARFNIQETKPVLYTIGNRKRLSTRRISELLITNF